MDPDSRQELQQAMKADAAGVADYVSALPEPEHPSASSSKRPCKRSAPHPAASSNLVSNQSSFSVSSLGIQCITRCKRKGMVCYFCNCGVDKGDMRFEYIHRVDKPARSIHTTCLLQVPPEARQPSIAKLRGMIENHDDDEFRSACRSALEFLSAS